MRPSLATASFPSCRISKPNYQNSSQNNTQNNTRDNTRDNSKTTGLFRVKRTCSRINDNSKHRRVGLTFPNQKASSLSPEKVVREYAGLQRLPPSGQRRSQTAHNKHLALPEWAGTTRPRLPRIRGSAGCQAAENQG
ncbi:MAG: hypothetical protein V2A73_13385 [Pseudomonadota bacterium]